MKKTSGFFTSFERYVRSVVGRSPLPRVWRWGVVGLLIIVLILSWTSRTTSMAGAVTLETGARLAARSGDYSLAQRLYADMEASVTEKRVLGASTELEEIVYPEARVAARISELQSKLEIYPGNRDIYLALSKLEAQIGDQSAADTYAEQARILDPNQ